MSHILGKPIDYWLIFGLFGQLCFTMRFLVQWIESERKKESIIPISFWIFSLLGSAILLSYAVYRRDPVFILGQSFGFIVYVRNLQFAIRKKAQSHGIAIRK